MDLARHDPWEKDAAWVDIKGWFFVIIVAMDGSVIFSGWNLWISKKHHRFETVKEW
jgi:hypothetical protein